MNREEAENFVYQSYMRAEKYQDYAAGDALKRRPDLTREILRGKQDPAVPCVVVTGSKGKGSVASMISQILQTRYHVGLMTSPHMLNFCERFKVDGSDISDGDFTDCMSAIAPELAAVDAALPDDVCISPIGIQAALALEYFGRSGTGFNVFECGKGAQYDDVNNLRHEYAVINSIFAEHTRELGKTVEAIAADKAHVMTGEQKCVFTAKQKPSVLEVLKKRAAQTGTRLKVYGEDFSAEDIRFDKGGMIFDVRIGEEICEDLQVPLLGRHQAGNCALALAMCREALGTIDIPAVRENLKKLSWPGRMEVLSAEPLVMLDACINSASCGNVKQVLKELEQEQVTTVIGIPDDKDYAGVVREMAPVSGRIILTRSQNRHYIFTPKQQEIMAAGDIETLWTGSVEEALEEAKKSGNTVIILGTTSLVGEVEQLYRKNDTSCGPA